MPEHSKITVNLHQAHIEALRAMAELEGEKSISVIVRGLIREAAQQRGLWLSLSPRLSQDTHHNPVGVVGTLPGGNWQDH